MTTPATAITDIVLGIDPGPYESAYCLLVEGEPATFAKVVNENFLAKLRNVFAGTPIVVIETIFPRGQSVGLETMNTQLWAGKYWEAAESRGSKVHGIDRQDVRFAICGSLDTNDSSVRQGLIDHYGGDRKAIGGKRCKTCKHGNMGTAKRPMQCSSCGGSGWAVEPGPLHKFAKDMWSALSIALAWRLRQQLKVPIVNGV